MSEGPIVALIAAGATLGGSALVWLTAAQQRTWRRLRTAEVTNHALWTYTRLLIDAHYVGGLGPPPPPPDHIKHLYETGANT